ncbi:uncharacterized protein LY79DRAFT_671182 [Colletotrichum navitas]|uniref:Uncharacterized protein n=1 Tax=Colletotrichum navitas TaxID=681940 RepID=A0AAD8PWS2_9PEZI|nr:uncharacterized protein LY79DRAFT_671182 [Colletotrichum navitas]KAK1585243.1 hypothetical protein LY79DRAFT_671182 [Colletotrichum navitas]
MPATSPHPALGASPSQIWSHTDKNRRASVVKVPSPLKQTIYSSSPAVPSTLRSVNFPPLDSPTRSPSSDSTIDVNQTPSARRPSVSVLGCRTGSVFDDDPFVTSQPSPQTFRTKSPFSKGCASLAEKVARQVANTRSLAHHGYRGPIEVGDFVCLIDPYTGQPDPIAANHPDGRGNTVIRDFRSQKDISEIMPSDNGRAEWGRKGEFKGFEDSIAAAWIRGAKLKSKTFNTVGKDAFMGARLGEGNEDVLVEEEEAPPATTQLGPTPYWIKKANEILGITNEGEDDAEGLFEYHDF